MLKATKIFKSYSHPVLSDVSLTAHRGEIIGIAGANGSGKSTLLSIITTIIKPDKGTVTVDDQSITPAVLKRSIGYVSQENALFDNLTVKDNLRYWASIGNNNASAVGFIGDPKFAKKKVKHLSGGMKRQLSISIATLNNPDFLIMDEPTAALDLYYKQSILQLIQETKKQGKTVIFASHNASELLVCDRLYVLKNGKFIYEGPPGGISNDEKFGESLIKLI